MQNMPLLIYGISSIIYSSCTKSGGIVSVFSDCIYKKTTKSTRKFDILLTRKGIWFMKDWQYILRNLSLLSQMGISLAAPLLLCLFLCSWLNSRFMIGGWIYIPGFIMGLGGSFMTAYKLYLAIMKEQKPKKKKNREHEKAFNRHVWSENAYPCSREVEIWRSNRQ